MTTGKRLTRHEMREPDQFQHGMDAVIRYLRQNRTTVTAAAIAVTVLAVAAIVAGSWYFSRESRASAALAKLVAVAERPVGGTTDPRDTGKGEPFPDQASKDNALIQEADAYLDRFGSAGSARAAKMIKAGALARRGRAADARALFGEVAGSSPRDVLGSAAAIAEASAQAEAGDVDGAIAALQRLAAGGNPVVPKDLVLKTAALLSEGAGRTDQAVKLYQRVIDETPESALVPLARSRVEDLGRKLQAEAPAPAAASASPTPSP